MKHKELVMYGVVGFLTTLVYFIVRFSVLNMIGHSLIAVIMAQLFSIIFSFFANKMVVFLNTDWDIKTLISQFVLFFIARLSVFFLDMSITYIAIERYGDYFIELLGFNRVNYTEGLFASPLLRGVIGSPAVLNELFFVVIIQVLAVVLNYVLSKKWVFKKS